MKIILLLALFLNNDHDTWCERPFSIKIWDANYSLAYTNLYTITNKTIEIRRISGVKGEKNSALLNQNLTEQQCKSILAFLESLKLDQLKDSYVRPLVADGNRKKVEINIEGKVKTVTISNYYQKDMGRLFSTLNEIILKREYKIKYIHSN